MTLVDTLVRDGLVRDGYVVVDGFLPEDRVARLREDLSARRVAGAFHRARVGRGDGRQLADEVRRDEIAWWETSAPGLLSSAQQETWAALEDLRGTLNRELFLGLRDLEAHYAVYAPGSFYRRHLDRFADDSSRVLSCVLYLNEDWRETDGGELRIYGATPDSPLHVQVAPAAGRLVCFLSARHYHEVRPTLRERWSIAVWFRDTLRNAR